MLIIEGGRSCLYQWDVGQRLEVVNSDVLEVHFSNAVIGAALVCEVYEEDGRRFANIPNVLLQQAWAIQAHGCCELRVRDVQVIRVVRREKPADYVYTETEVKRYEDLDKRLRALEENGGGGGGAVQSVNGKTGRVELTAEDVGALPSTGGKVGGSVNATGTLTAGQGNTYVARLAGASGMAMMSAVDKSGKMVNNIQLSPSRTTLGQPLAVNSGGHGGKTPAEGRKNLEVDSSTEVSDKIAAQVERITPATISAIADRDGIIQERHLGAQVVKNASIAYGAVTDSRIAEKTITFQRLSDACVEDIKKAALPTASADIKGGVKVGEGLQMDGDVLGVQPDDEPIASILIEGSDVYSVQIDKDVNGNPFDLVYAKVRFVSPVFPEQTVDGTNVVFLNRLGGKNESDRILTLSYGIPPIGKPSICFGEIYVDGDTVYGLGGRSDGVGGRLDYIYSQTKNGAGIKELLIKGTTIKPFVDGTEIVITGKRREARTNA